jgi:hypothetical protein
VLRRGVGTSTRLVLSDVSPLLCAGTNTLPTWSSLVRAGNNADEPADAIRRVRGLKVAPRTGSLLSRFSSRLVPGERVSGT